METPRPTVIEEVGECIYEQTFELLAKFQREGVRIPVPLMAQALAYAFRHTLPEINQLALVAESEVERELIKLILPHVQAAYKLWAAIPA